MFPIAFSAGSTADRVLRADDIAGISDITREPGQDRAVSAAYSGKVHQERRRRVGAHIIAFNVHRRSGLVVSRSTTRGVHDWGLDSGTYVLRPSRSMTATSKASSTFEQRRFELRRPLHDRVVVVPLGGGAGDVEIKVTPKCAASRQSALVAVFLMAGEAQRR